VQGIGPLSGSRAILLRNNRARAGGAVYVECSDIGSVCAAAFDTTNKIGALPHLPKVEFTGSRASMYGDTIATHPASTRWYERTPAAVKIVPSRASQCTDEAAQSLSSAYQQLVAAVQPLDSFGSLARGLANTFSKVLYIVTLHSKYTRALTVENLCQEDVAEVRVCRTLGPCTKYSATQPVFYAPFDDQTGVSSSSFQLECPLGMGGNKVALEVALVRFAEVPVLRALIQCGQCRAGETRTEDKASDTWFCVACAGNTYVIDPNNAAHSCQDCPAGGSCNGSAFTPLPGSKWERDDAAGVYRSLGCAAGSFIVTAPYRLQACLPCQAGYYCPGDAAPALKCPANTFAAPGARAKEACVEANFVGLTVSLPLSVSEFDEAKQTGYKRSIASTAGVIASYVEIVSFAQTSTRRSEARKLLAAALEVETKIASTQGNIKDLVERLDPDAINKNLEKNGLPPGKVTRTPAVIRDATDDTWWTTLRIIMVVVGLVLGLFLIGLVVFMCCRNKVETSYEEKRQDARWRVEARQKEFEERFAAEKERTREAQERKKRQEVRATRRQAASLHLEVGTAFGTVPQGNFLDPPEPAAVALRAQLQPAALRAQLQIVTSPEGQPYSGPSVTASNSSVEQQRREVEAKIRRVEAELGVLRIKFDASNSCSDTLLGKSATISATPAQRAVKPEGIARDVASSRPASDVEDVVIETIVVPPPVQDPAQTETKFEAKKLVLGKSEDSVLLKHLGLTEKELASALADPMAAIEQEWFPRGFRLLEHEPQVGSKDYGDDEYWLEMAKAQHKFEARELDEDEFQDEKQRLQHEYETRNYKLWSRGATFDYIRYGVVEDKKERPREAHDVSSSVLVEPRVRPRWREREGARERGSPSKKQRERDRDARREERDGRFWLPPLVRYKEEHGWGCSFIEPGDYDTGHFDDLFILLELDIPAAETGEVNEKGHENQARKIFKQRIVGDLSRACTASTVSIGADGLVVVTVTPVDNTKNRVQVVVMVLQDPEAQRGPDECWEVVKDLYAQSLDLNSDLLQGQVTRHLVLGGITLERERHRTGMTLEDFAKHPICVLAGLSLWHVFALRAYTTDAYPWFNDPMRMRTKPHPIMFTMYFLDQALKMLTTGALAFHYYTFLLFYGVHV
jgi:hypothetical protein